MPSPGQSSICLTRQQLESYLQGSLPSQLVPACEEHLNDCERCQAVLAELFEIGHGPEWLAVSGRTDQESQLDGSQVSTQGTDREAGGSPLGPAHLLWQQVETGRLPMPSPAMAVGNIPEMIGRYRIESILGSGGFGRVYLAYDEKLKRKVALKVPHLAAHRRQVHWELMLSEAQTVAALDHPSIVPIFDVATTEDIPLFLVSKLIVGQTLAERLESGPLEPQQAVQVLLHVADALEYAHEHGVIHRDIKPQNILLDKTGQVFLSDFGLAWRQADSSREFPSAGTPYYMSPEQLAGQLESIDQRSDIYSLGKVLQEMLGLLHQDPLAGLRHARSQVSVLGAQPEQLQTNEPVQYQAHVPAGLIAICEKATAADRQARYQQVSELRDALQATLDFPRPRRFRVTRGGVLVGLAIVVLAALVAIPWYRQSTAEARAAQQAVNALLNSDWPELSERTQSQQLRSPAAVVLLRQALASDNVDQRLRASLGLLPVARSLVPVVADEMLSSQTDQAMSIITPLVPYVSQLSNRMWQTLQNDENELRRLNAACYLAAAAVDDRRWDNEALVDKLLLDLQQQSPAEVKGRTKYLQDKRDVLLAGLRRFRRAASPETTLSPEFYFLWENLVKEDLSGSIELLLLCPQPTFHSILGRLKKHDQEVIRMLREYRINPGTLAQLQLDELKQQQAAAQALRLLGYEEDYWALWRSQSDPRHLTLHLTHLADKSLDPQLLIQRLRNNDLLTPIQSLPAQFMPRMFKAPLSERRNLLLALTTREGMECIQQDTQILDAIARLYQLDADSCVHELSSQILKRTNRSLPQLDKSNYQPADDRGWFVNSLADTMVVVLPNPSNIYSYAIASRETQRQHFEQFVKETGYDWPGTRIEGDKSDTNPGQHAQGGLSWYDCAAFCNWLSRREGLEECYLPNAEGKYAAGMTIKANVLQLNGYRLPTEPEWQTAARAAAFADLTFGNIPSVQSDYLWSLSNARGIPQAPAQLRPNNLGLFDVHGNVSEWSMFADNDFKLPTSIVAGHHFRHFGGSARDSKLEDFFFTKSVHSPVADRTQLTGLRVARSLPEHT